MFVWSMPGSREEDLLISPWKRAKPFIWTNLNPYHPKMIFAKFGWYWPSSSGLELFFRFVNVFSQLRNYLPLEKGGALHSNNPESPLPKNALCQVWLKLAKWFLRTRFLKFVNVFSLFRYYLPLGKGGTLHLNKLEFPSPGILCAKFGLK